MPSGLSQSHQEIAGQFQWELLQLTCLGSGGQQVQRPPPRGARRVVYLVVSCSPVRPPWAKEPAAPKEGEVLGPQMAPRKGYFSNRAMAPSALLLLVAMAAASDPYSFMETPLGPEVGCMLHKLAVSPV